MTQRLALALLALLACAPLRAAEPAPSALPPGALIYYNLDEGRGTVANSLVSSFSCTMNGTVNPAWVSGQDGNALQFFGGNCRCETGTSSLGTLLSNFTIMVLQKSSMTFTRAGDKGMSLFGQWQPGYSSFFALRLTDGVVDAQVNGDTPQGCTGNIHVSSDTWNVLTITRQIGINREVYVDDVLDKVCASASQAFSVNQLRISGDDNGPNMDYFGLIDVVIVWPRRLTPGEIKYAVSLLKQRVKNRFQIYNHP